MVAGLATVTLAIALGVAYSAWRAEQGAIVALHARGAQVAYTEITVQCAQRGSP